MEELNRRKISVCIPTYNRYEFTIDAVKSVFFQDFTDIVDEVVICDDCSTDGSYNKLLAYFKYLHPASPYNKVKLFRNEKNLDCYLNKRRAVELASNDFVVILDSDNKLTRRYLNAISETEWRTDIILAPVFAMPDFDYRVYSEWIINKSNVNVHINSPLLQTALNTMNYFVNRAEYLNVFDDTVNPVTADSIYQNYRWLLHGNTIRLKSGMEYEHRVHDQSHYVTNNHKTGSFYDKVIALINELK